MTTIPALPWNDPVFMAKEHAPRPTMSVQPCDPASAVAKQLPHANTPTVPIINDATIATARHMSQPTAPSRTRAVKSHIDATSRQTSSSANNNRGAHGAGLTPLRYLSHPLNDRPTPPRTRPAIVTSTPCSLTTAPTEPTVTSQRTTYPRSVDTTIPQSPSQRHSLEQEHETITTDNRLPVPVNDNHISIMNNVDAVQHDSRDSTIDHSYDTVV
ncbi:hypothetical protein EDB85DRAFT_2152750 [Lactarius pseudohatsudake]|nr:hypothetical protein EDB85DRAFT_2152750 [Lactarius pseudohatsudake]